MVLTVDFIKREKLEIEQYEHAITLDPITDTSFQREVNPNFIDIDHFIKINEKYGTGFINMKRK